MGNTANFMRSLAPDTVSGTQIEGADQRGQEALGRAKDHCAGHGYCFPVDDKDWKAIEKLRKRGQRGGARFRPADAF